MPSSSFKAIVVKLDPSLRAKLDTYAKANSLSISGVVRLILAQALSEGGGDIEAQAFNDGIKRGLAEAKKAIAEAVAALWR